MAWNAKYWDIISNLYWTPRYLGLKSIPRNQWTIEGDRASISLASISNSTGPLYSRSRTFSETKSYLHGQEEILNQVFNIALSIAGDDIVSSLLCGPLGIIDSGPFESIGREIGARFGWRPNENVTQQDGFFITPSSLIAVELKLGSMSWPEQIAKYIALMIWEQETSGRRPELGLLFIVPEKAVQSHWESVGLNSSRIDADFLSKLKPEKLPKKVQKLFSSKSIEVGDALNRIKLAVISWNQFHDQVEKIERDAKDHLGTGGQTLVRLLEGLRAQISAHLGAY